MCVCISIRKRRAACAWFKWGVWGVDDVREGEEEKDDDDDDDDDDSMLSVCLSVCLWDVMLVLMCTLMGKMDFSI